MLIWNMILHLLLFSAAWSIRQSWMATLATTLLLMQCTTSVLVINHQALKNAGLQVPQRLAPSAFMVGLVTGLTVGATILSYFLARVFGQFYSFCKAADANAQTNDDHPCGKWEGRVWGVWWWSSGIFWCNLLLVFLFLHNKSRLASSEHTGSGSGYDSLTMQEEDQHSAYTPYNNIPDANRTEATPVLQPL